MMQLLLNSDDQLIVEAYEKKMIDKDQIQSLYEDMQFLGKFLKDSPEEKSNDDDEHEQLKLLVSKIRDVTCEVDDSIDSLMVNAVLQRRPTRVFADELRVAATFCCKMVDLAEKIYRGIKTITAMLDSEKFYLAFRTNVIKLLSWFEYELAEKFGDCFPHITEDFKRSKMDVMRILEDGDGDGDESESGSDMPCKMDVMHILEDENEDPQGKRKRMRKQLCRELLQSESDSDMPDEFRVLFKLSEMMVYRTKRIRECLTNQHLKGASWHEFHIADDIDLLLSLSQETADLVRESTSKSLISSSELTERIKETLVTIYDKASRFTSLDSHMADEFHFRYKIIKETFVQYPRHYSWGFVCVIRSTKMEMMNIYERDLSLPWLDCCPGESCDYFGSVTHDIKSIKTEVEKIYEKKLYGITGGGGGVLPSGKSNHGPSPKPIRPIVHEETVVGLDQETETIKELLIEEHEKQLKYISIVGMPGLGKTTLAKKVYNDSFIEYHFYIRAWVYVSQAYEKRDLLLAIFNSAFHSRDDICNMRDENLGHELYKRLKDRRYLIIIDDIWNLGPWDDLKSYFPNDNNGSRILFTTRHEDVSVALHAKLHCLRFLNEDESWDLFRLKTFCKESCPPELMEIGKQIARKCRGLPLAIVVISGLLAKQDKTLEWWKHVAESVSSYMVSDPEQYMHTLELSYNFLPHYLKACFLYLGAFTEDYEIPVQKLVWLWVAEGFIWQNEQKTLEEVAEDYLMDLIDRSLVIVSNKRSNGEIKACCVHNLLRDLCLKKAQEENFLHQVSIKGHKDNLLQQISDKVQEGVFLEQIFGKAQEEKLLQHISENVQEENLFQQIFGSSSSSTILNKHRRMCIHPDLANFTSLKHYPFKSKVCSILSFGNLNSCDNLDLMNVQFINQNFALLRVLDLSSIQIPFFPERMTQLVLLRYLALHVKEPKNFLPSTSNLWNLQTLILECSKGLLVLSDDIWKIVKLRHLYTKRLIEFSSIHSDGHAFLLDNLQTVGKLHLHSGEEQALKWIPNLRKLKCYITKTLNGDDHFPRLNFLIHLETLNVISSDCKRFFHLDNFPPSLRSLTLSYVGLSWEEMSTLGMLPNLEVLKLLDEAFEGPRWDTRDGEFRKLRFLKFKGLDIGQWNASSNHFPYLQQLVLEECARLEEIPSGLGDISTLETIQLWCCSRSAENSARQIQEEQRSMGNDGLKIKILACRWNSEMVISEDLAT